MAYRQERQLIPFKDWLVWTVTVGPGPRTPLVCIPGGPGMASDYLVALAPLSASRPLVLYDPLGAGRSTRRPAVEWSLPLLRDEVLGVCGALGLQRPHLFAHAAGCLVALEAVLKEPHRFGALVLSSPPVDVPAVNRSVRQRIQELDPDAAAALERGELDRSARGEPYQRAYVAFARRHVCRAPGHLLMSLRRMGRNNHACHRALKGGLLLYTAALRELNLKPRLGAIANPTLLTCGRHDIVTAEMLAEVRALMPNAALQLFEASSNTQHLEENAAYVDSVRSFLDRSEAA
jgi:proline iminopeptidase